MFEKHARTLIKSKYKIKNLGILGDKTMDDRMHPQFMMNKNQNNKFKSLDTEVNICSTHSDLMKVPKF